MPTQTFFRLPEEKRERLIEAAWKEFTAVSFADASINRIVRDAHIPRGSFYQYFEDKEDLFFHLLGTLREEAFGLMDEALRSGGGDPFRALLLLFDEVFRGDGQARPSMTRVIETLRLNQNMDVSQVVMDRLQSDPGIQELEARVDWTRFYRTDKAFHHDVAALMVFSFACALHNVLCDGASLASERAKLCSRLDVIRRGSVKEEMAS